jgi:hypothetical protein
MVAGKRFRCARGAAEKLAGSERLCRLARISVTGNALSDK